jgi:hypothetical protein
MPRRTGLDTIFDNENMPTARDLKEMADTLETQAQLETAPLDHEDYNQLREGHPGEYGNRGEGTGKGSERRYDKREPMDEEEYEAAISGGVSAAEDYIDMQISPDREYAARCYRGDLFGNEMENRSQVVMTEVRDAVLSMLPALLRIFCGTMQAVEFINNSGTPAELGTAQTAYVNHIIHNENEGFVIFHSAFKDALVRKTGIFTWWYEEKETVGAQILTGLNEEAYALLQIEKKEASNENEVFKYEIEVLDERPDTTAPEEQINVIDLLPEPAGGIDDTMMFDDGTAPGPGPEDQPEPPQNFIRDVRVRKVQIIKKHCVGAVPPEEFILSPATSANLDEFQLVGRRQMKTIGELVALGHDEDEIREKIGGAGTDKASVSLTLNLEATDRQGGAPLERLFDTSFSNADPASEFVKYVVCYVLIDKDGDGIPERRKICTVGNNNAIIYDEMVDEMVPFAIVCPDPEPHSPFGYSLADQTIDMQEIKSEIVRGILDALAESVVGRTGIVEGKVNIDDALSNDRDQLIRVKDPGAIFSLSKPFTGMNAVPVLQYLDDVKARRTGMTLSPAGLSADTLQSTDSQVADAVVNASQERSEMVARIFAETGIRRLFRGLIRQCVRHQDQKKMLRLRGRPVTVDPRDFNVDLDLQVNVGLGKGTATKRTTALSLILAQQKEVLTLYGMNNPIVNLHHVSNTVEDLIHANEFHDVSRYMSPVSADDAKKLADAEAAKPPKPTPEELLYKAQSEKVAADLKRALDDNRTKLLLAGITDDQKRDKAEQDFFINAAKVMGDYGIKIDEQELRARMEEMRSADTMAEGANADATQAMAQATQTGE